MNLKKILTRKLRALFPEEQQRAEVLATLEAYGVEKHEQELDRVRLAVLKLSGGDLE
jgi:hypothetical protein